MNFAFSEDQEALRKVVKDFLNAKSDEATVRELMDTESGYDEVEVPLSSEERFGSLIGKSPQMRAIFAQLGPISASSVSMPPPSTSVEAVRFA